jgi:hypothetical protein
MYFHYKNKIIESAMNKKMTLDKKVLMKLMPDDAKIKFDKYVSPFINFLNSIAGSKTSPNYVGQLSELFQDFINECSQKNIKPSIEK